MKCPKCGYLGFEDVDRCRNCGYDFSLAAPAPLPDLTIRSNDTDADSLDDLALIDSASAGPARISSPEEFDPAAEARAVQAAAPVDTSSAQASVDEFRLFADSIDDVPLITKPSAPRPPLAVRRSTPEVARVRTPPRTPMLDLAAEDEEHELAATVTPAARARTVEWATTPEAEPRERASFGERIAAALIDIGVLGAIDFAVIYFTLQICGLTFATASSLPLAPLAAFLLIQNGGYLIAFTAEGQTLGKMVAGIKVVAVRPGAPLDVGRATLRSLMWLLLAAPAGLGFVTALFNREQRGLHDQVAGTRVVRTAAV